jgi:hypothetical protein
MLHGNGVEPPDIIEFEALFASEQTGKRKFS